MIEPNPESRRVVHAPAAPGRAQSERRVRTPFARARILLVDDEETNLVLLGRLLKSAGFENIRNTRDSTQVVSLVDSFAPDLICLDLNMPRVDGFEVLHQLSAVIPRGTYLPILMLTGDATPGTLQHALSLGATDFVAKPFDGDEVRLRIHNLLVPRFMHLELQHHNRELESRVKERTRALEDSQIEVLERLARASEFRDDDTGQHTRRVGLNAGQLATSFGLSADFTDLITRAATLHDIGKIGVPDGILLKAGPLSESEFAMMKSHTRIGAEILHGGRTPLVQMARAIAHSHHEKWDGTGYPEGLSGEQIPLAARIVAIADFFDALTHDRPYRKAWTIEQTLEEIGKQRGRHFDPELVGCFLKLRHAALV